MGLSEGSGQLNHPGCDQGESYSAKLSPVRVGFLSFPPLFPENTENTVFRIYRKHTEHTTCSE